MFSTDRSTAMSIVPFQIAYADYFWSSYLCASKIFLFWRDTWRTIRTFYFVTAFAILEVSALGGFCCLHSIEEKRRAFAVLAYSPGNSPGAAAPSHDSSQGSSSPLPSVTGRAAIGLEDQLLVHEEVHLPSSPSLQVVFK